MKSLVLMILSMLVIQGCNAPGNSVTITSGGITTNALFSMNNEDIDGKTVDLGEHILTNDPKLLTIRVYNKTQYPYTELDLILSADGDNSPSITFNPNVEGSIAFPGDGGTCGRVLPSKTACEIKVLFAPREGRRYLETLTLRFKNFVDPEEHIAHLKLIAGMPASLTFTNDITQYTFGDIVGTANLPVVERADVITYEEELEVINAGGLPAKNLLVSLTEACISTETNNCPTGMSGAYTIENACPIILDPGEKCKVKVRYTPKNQDPTSGPIPTDIYEINYRSTVNFSYIKDPTGVTAALNGYFRSISTNIEARFKVALATVSFETPVVSGNRDVRSFRINNVGFREGEIRAIAFRDSGSSLIATCKSNPSSDYLLCVDGSNNPVPLSVLPFTLKDRNQCLTGPSETPVHIAVGNGCIFDLYFQPSVTFTTDKNTEFLNLQPEVVFDSRWKATETIKTTKIFNLSAKSKAAAKLEIDKIRLDGTEYTATGTGPWVSDLGRLTLQSPSFFKRKALIVTFKNNGSVAAFNVSIKDASNRAIPIGGSGTNLGAKTPYFYSSAIASESTCTLIGPGESCSMTMMFAPIGMATNAEEDANMFDAVGMDARKYKGFIISYDSGARYSDDNIENGPNLPSATAEARIQAELVRKGMLMQFAEDSRNVSNFGSNVNVAGDTIISHLYLQNIGTGPIPYIRLMNPPSMSSTPPSWNTSLIPTADPAALGADYDCLAIGDEDLTYTVPGNADPSTRTGLFSALPKDKSCVYTVQMKMHDRFRHFNSQSCTNVMPQLLNANEGIRTYSRALDSAGGTALYDFCQNGTQQMEWNGISIDYYDGDTSDPNLTPADIYGRRVSLEPYNYRAVQHWMAKLIPHSFMPFLTATLYRPAFTYPTISGTQTAKNITETWFYGLAQNYNYVMNDPAQTSPFLQGDDSRNFVPLLPGFADKANYDYIFYLGSFPQGIPAFNFPLGLRNFGNITTRLLSYNVTPDPAFTALSLPAFFPYTVAPGNNVNPLSFNFNPSTMGEHRMVVEYEYETGRHIDPLVYKSSVVATNAATAGKQTLTQKILVIAHVQQAGTHPEVSMTVEDYDVVENPGAPPSESLLPPTNPTLSWNTNIAPSNMMFDTIKLTSTPTANDMYAKKRITYTNNTAYPLYDLKTIYRQDQNSSTVKTIPSSFSTVSSGTTCTPGMTLNAFSSCTLILKYQPVAADTSDNFYMSLVYKMSPGQYVMQNISVSLLPRSPGQLLAFGKTTETINYKVTPTSTTTQRSSYGMNFGTVTLNISPKPFKFDALSSTYKKLEFRNAQSTKASLLLSYQKYISANSLRGYSPGTPAPSSLIPAAGEYRVHTDGESYAPIYMAKYTDLTDRLVIEASKGCLFGDDESNGAVAAHQKGFNNATVKPCYVLVNFYANFEYLRKTISISNGDDMREAAAELWYFSVNRTSTSSVWVHVKGVINPDTSVASGSNANVVALENKTVSFSTQKMTPSNALMGSVVGLRVLMSSSATGLNDPYSTGITTYVDIRPYDSTSSQYVNFLTGLANGQYFYFRVVAIRKDTRFVDTTPKRFVGLLANEYLSATTSYTPLKVLVPPVNHYYFHDSRLLIEKSMYGGIAYDPYLTAFNRCALRPKITVKNPSNVSYSYELIDLDAWNLLLATPAATSYANMTQTSHWVAESPVSIDAKCTGMPGFTPGVSSQMLNSSSTFYIRNSSTPSANVMTAVGGVPGTTNSDYDSYVDGSVGFASSRCMVVLPP